MMVNKRPNKKCYTYLKDLTDEQKNLVSKYMSNKKEFMEEALFTKWSDFLEGKQKETDSAISSHVSGELTDDEI